MKNCFHITRLLSTGIILLASISKIFGQPAPGDIFREYTFIPENGHFGELDPKCTREFTEEIWKNKPRMVIKILDLELANAIRAEMSMEYWGGHIGTSEQKFKINGNEWIYIPQPQNTPSNPLCYHRTLLGNSSVPVPLEHLKNGENKVQFTCGPQICYNFNFGFYWIYSFTVRIYYDASVPHTEGEILLPHQGNIINDNPEIVLEISEHNHPVKQVDFIGYYKDFDWEGNGIFKQWHYQTQYGKMFKHIGTSTKKPYKVTWNTKWFPDQEEPFKIAAIITDDKGISYVTPGVEDVVFKRTDRSVRMYRSDDVPEAFAVRVGREEMCTIIVEDDTENATSACLLLSTWSGKCDDGSIHELLFNGKRISDNFGRLHDYSYDFISVPLDYIREVNEISIHSTFEGHALEINWPGPVLLIEFRVY